jgi:cytochrome c oxidase subunit 2
MPAGEASVNARRIAIILILTVVLISAGVVVGSTVNLMPTEASEQAQMVDRLFRGLMGVATVVFLLVEGALLYAVLRFRRRSGDDAEGPAVHGNNTLETIWIAIPALIVIVIAFASFRVLTESAAAEPQPLVVEVVGRQFTWEFRYPDADVSSAELHLPLNRQVRFQISSADVIHSLWIPDFRIKQDATPGRMAEMVITPTLAGRFPIRCAEFCGAGHAVMTSEVVVESEQEFDGWLQSQQAMALAGGPGQPGRQVFTLAGCSACHTLTDAGAQGTVGPSLDGIGTRAGTRVPGLDAQAYIEQSILDPNAFVVEGFPSGVMPQDFRSRLSQDELQALVDYLLSQ